jgi:membrane-bound serine protease (ClpP class)
LTIAIILLGLAFAFIVLEVFVPSGGALTLLAIGSLVVSVYFAFAESELAGALFLAAGIIGMPLLAWKMLGLFPKTSVGRRFLLFGPKGHEEVATSSELKLREFEGKRGVTRTTLRPTGVAKIDGERVNVVSEGMIIEPGTPVEVVEISGNRVVVKEIEESDGQEEDSVS